MANTSAIIVAFFAVGLIIGVGISYVSLPARTSTVTSTANQSQTPSGNSVTTTEIVTTTKYVTTTVIAQKLTGPSTLSIRVTKAFLDQYPLPGFSNTGFNVYIYFINITNIGQNRVNIDGGNLEVVTNVSLNYPNIIEALQIGLIRLDTLQPGQPWTLASGESVVGQAAFRVPVNQQVSRIVYDDATSSVAGTSASISNVYGQVSFVNLIDLGVNLIGNTSGLSGINMPVAQDNNSFFYSGEIMNITIAGLSCSYGTTVTAVNVSNGLTVVGTTPSLPYTAPSASAQNYCGESVLYVHVRVPSYYYNGGLNITLTLQ